MFENSCLLFKLTSLGDIVKTNYHIDTKKYNQIIEKYSQHWKAYNPRDTKNNRYGLSLTSLDGGFSGKPDLDSLSQLRKETGVEYLETDFKTYTPLANELSKECDVFNNYELGRSHIIKLDKGGHFPPHRDLDDTFRMICWLDSSPPERSTFLLENVSLNLQKGVFYFINTIKYHSLFSFEDNQKMIVLNVNLDEKNIYQLYKDRYYK